MLNEQTMRLIEACLDIYKSNKQVAHEFEIDRKAVGALRKLMGVKPLHSIFRPEDMSLLMDRTLAPSVVAEMVGCSPQSVWSHRKRLGFYQKYRKRRYAKKTTTNPV